MHGDIKWFFGIIVVFAAFFFAAGVSKISNQNPSANTSTYTENDPNNSSFSHIGANSSYGVRDTSSTAGNTYGYPVVKKLSTTEEIAKGLNDAGIKAEAVKKELASLEEAQHASPLTGKLAIIGRTAGGQVSSEYILLRASPQNKEKILISGLRLESRVSGRGANIGKGVPLVFQNQINQEEAIYLNPGDSAYIITGRSPIGVSFKLNKCTGFFNQYQSFNPSLPSRCPRITEKDLPSNGTYYNDACRNYINGLPSCRVILNPPSTISPECNRYVTTEISYTKCVNSQKNTPDFYDPVWRVYLTRDETLWKSSRELIHLVDQNGKVIDAVTY